MARKTNSSSPKKRQTIHKAVARCFARLANKPCWNVRQGHGSYLYFEFGEPHLIVDEWQSKNAKGKLTKKRNASVKGDLHLWIYCCDWKITLKDHVGANSESSHEKIWRALAQLGGQILRSVSVNPDEGSSIFEFDLGGKLETSAYPHDDEGEPWENWMLFDDEQHVLVYRADGKYAYHLADEASEEWLA